MSMTIGNELPTRPTANVRLDASLENTPLGDVPRNGLATEQSPTAAYEFARAAATREDVVGTASGVFDGRLYIWLFLETIDVAATRALFDLQAAFEHRHQGRSRSTSMRCKVARFPTRPAARLSVPYLPLRGWAHSDRGRAPAKGTRE